MVEVSVMGDPLQNVGHVAVAACADAIMQVVEDGLLGQRDLCFHCFQETMNSTK
jgi:hypothetical protein